jgi:hypothetical protein
MSELVGMRLLVCSAAFVRYSSSVLVAILRIEVASLHQNIDLAGR